MMFPDVAYELSPSGSHSGGATLSVDGLVKSMGMTGIGRSEVSRLCEEIDEQVGAFLSRPIEGGRLYLWIDATHLRVRQAGRIVSVAFWGLPKLRETSADLSYDNGLYAAAFILAGSAVRMAFMPKYRYAAGQAQDNSAAVAA